MKFFVRVGETFIGVKIDRSGIEFKNLSATKAQIDADVAAKKAIMTVLETNVETLKRENQILREIIDGASGEPTGENKSLAKSFDRDIAVAYMNKAVREGRTEDDGFENYLETLGISRSEKTDALLSKTRERDRELDKRLKRNLDEFRMNTSAA